MLGGKIAVACDSLGSHKKIMDHIMYDVVGIDPANIVSINDNPDVIIAVGEKIFNQYCGIKEIMKYAGTIHYYGSIPVVPVVHPGYLEYNSNYLRKFAEDIQLAYQVSIGLDKVIATNQYVVVQNLNEIEQLVEYCKQTGYCSFDFETTELTDMGTFDPDFYCTTVSISFQQGSSYVIPLYHYDSPFKDCIPAVVSLLQLIFNDPTIIKIGHHVKFDMHCAAWLGIKEFRGMFHDTMLMHHLLNEIPSHKLKDIVRDYYPRFANYEQAVGKDWANVPLDKLAKYNALDSDLTLRLYWVFVEMLLEDPVRYIMYRNLTAPATKVLFYMEENGMLIDKTFLIDAIRQINKFIEDQEETLNNYPEVERFNLFRKGIAIEEHIKVLEEKYNKDLVTEYKSKTAQENQKKRLEETLQTLNSLKTGEFIPDIEPVNFNSPDQLKDLLFKKEGFGFVISKASMGLEIDSTRKENLDLINDKTGFIEDLQIYRQLKRIESTYLSSILKKLDKDHYIHTAFNQHGTKTGRLSSEKPNLQNIITRTKFKKVEESVKLVKKSFIPPEGYTLIAADYSQIELRVIAHYAQEKNMLKVYQNNEDIHEATAANSRGFTMEEFKKLDAKLYKQYRFEAKAENFGYVYGISAVGFKEYARTEYGMNISLRDAEKKREAYFKKYPGLLDYHRLYINKAKKFKYVRTFFGRRVHLPDIDSINGAKRGHAERNAINSPIQGTAGELTVFSMILLYYRLPEIVKINNDVHDALYFYIPDKIIDSIKPLIKETMEKPLLMEYFGKTIDSVPIKVDFEESKKSWGDIV